LVLPDSTPFFGDVVMCEWIKRNKSKLVGWKMRGFFGSAIGHFVAGYFALPDGPHEADLS